jgi:hypothetical protein
MMALAENDTTVFESITFGASKTVYIQADPVVNESIRTISVIVPHEPEDWGKVIFEEFTKHPLVE